MSHDFRYEQCDIPEGQTIGQHRRARAADATPHATRRRGLLRLLPSRRRPPGPPAPLPGR